MDNISFYLILALVLLVVLFAGAAALKALQKRQRRSRQGDRLGIMEVLDLEEGRQLVLVRRDSVEHLLLIGGEAGDVVVETGIGQKRAASVSETHATPPSAPPPPPHPRAPAAFAPRRPAPPAPPPPPEAVGPDDDFLPEERDIRPHAEPRVPPPVRED